VYRTYVVGTPLFVELVNEADARSRLLRSHSEGEQFVRFSARIVRSRTRSHSHCSPK
jgi:hypothetical protein